MTGHTLSSGKAVACEDNSRSGGPGSPHLAEICSHSQGPPCLGGGLPELMRGANGPVRIGVTTALTRCPASVGYTVVILLVETRSPPNIIVCQAPFDQMLQNPSIDCPKSSLVMHGGGISGPKEPAVLSGRFLPQALRVGHKGDMA
jgi:hypothetical protein